MAGHERVGGGERAERSGERHLLPRRERLLAEEQHAVPHPCRAQLRPGQALGLPQIEVVDDGTEGSGERFDTHGAFAYHDDAGKVSTTAKRALA